MESADQTDPKSGLSMLDPLFPKMINMAAETKSLVLVRGNAPTERIVTVRLVNTLLEMGFVQSSGDEVMSLQ